MKIKLIILLLLFLDCTLSPLFAQISSTDATEVGGIYPIQENDATHPCITPEQYKIIEKGVSEKCKQLKIKSNKSKAMSTTFSWPLRMANGLKDFSYYYVAAYVDQDTTAGHIKDYNCGTNTYDSHRGDDIAIIPYPFYKMDNNQVEVIAAAPGTIVNKVDGNFDKNCAANNSTANYIIIEHADGSVALYWHMKKNSLTSKSVGQTVVTGEFLGVVGSSGSSSAPHLHFEVWSGTTPNTLQESYAGTCNIFNATSLWTSQKAYTEPAIVKLSVNTAAPVFPACPITETLNEDTCFSAGSSARFYIFIRNETAPATISERIVNPNGTTYSSWNHICVNNTVPSYYYMIRTLPSTPGIYTFETVYNGVTYSKQFVINCGQVGVSDIYNSFTNTNIKIFPNPFSTQTVFHTDNFLNNATLTVYDVFGKTVKEIKNISGQTVTLSRDNLPSGLYFVRLTDENKIYTDKLVVTDK